MTNTIQVHYTTSLGTNGIPVRITSRRPTSIFPIGFNTRNPHNLIPIKRHEPSHRPVAPIRTLPNAMVLNARSIFNKVDELKALIDNYKSDILFVTETWLTESIPNEAVDIILYILIYIKDDIQ